MRHRSTYYKRKSIQILAIKWFRQYLADIVKRIQKRISAYSLRRVAQPQPKQHTQLPLKSREYTVKGRRITAYGKL